MPLKNELPHTIMKITLRTIGLCGILLFGAFFSLTFATPQLIEESARGFVAFQIEKEVREKHQNVNESSLANKALSIAGKLGLESEQIQEDLLDDLPNKIASVIASMCGYDCEKKKAIAQSITSDYLQRLKNIELAQNTLGKIVKGKYLEIAANLKLDLRIFLGANAIMFVVLLTVSFARPAAIAH